MPQRRVPSPLSLRRKLKGLTLQGKIALLSGAGPWITQAEPAIGLSAITMSDGPAGVRGDRWVGDTSVNIPSSTALAATWDGDLVERIGRLLAAEAQRKGVDLVLAPTVNLHRTPFGGRHFECWSEDPLLTGELAAALVEGIQSQGVGACAKHFVANETETDRMSYEVEVDERTLREVYLAPFERLVAQGVWTIMAAYNGVNGHTMTESPLLESVLRNEWGFDGLVVSDWTAVRSTVQAANAGTDLAMPGPNPFWEAPLVDAVENGQVSPDTIDDKLERLLRLAWRLGKLDPIETNPRLDGAREDASGSHPGGGRREFRAGAKPGRDSPLRPGPADDRRRYRSKRSSGSDTRRGQRICRSPLRGVTTGRDSRLRWEARQTSYMHQAPWSERHTSCSTGVSASIRSRMSPVWRCVCSMPQAERSAGAT